MAQQTDNERRVMERVNDGKNPNEWGFALAAIADLLDGKAWNADTLDAIAGIVRSEEFTVRDLAEPGEAE